MDKTCVSKKIVSKIQSIFHYRKVECLIVTHVTTYMTYYCLLWNTIIVRTVLCDIAHVIGYTYNLISCQQNYVQAWGYESLSVHSTQHNWFVVL